jgi:chemotaxis protein CheD
VTELEAALSAAGTPPGTMVTVSIADIQISNDPQTVLITHALGSCIAVMVHDPVRVVGGMIHYMLPASQIAPEKAEAKPAMFADTGIPLLFARMYELGCRKQDLVVKAAGGGQIADASGTFNIGSRNHAAMRKIFWKNNVLVAAEDIGGSKSRTARLFIGTGLVTITSPDGVLSL